MRLSKRYSQLSVALCLLAASACGQSADVSDAEQESQRAIQDSDAALIERARGIHDRVITLDTHNDISTAISRLSGTTPQTWGRR